MQEKICLNLSALLHLDFEQQLEVSARAGFRAVGPRDINLQEYLSAGHSMEDALRLMERFGLKSVEYNFFPNWIYAADSERGGMLSSFEEFCTKAAALGEGSIIVAPVSFENRNDVLDYELAVNNLQELSRVADSFGVLVGVEFLPWTRIDSISRAWDIVREADMENAGIILDSFHYFEGSSTETELRKVPVEKIFLCHLNDMNTNEGDILTRTREQRVLPGEGHYQFGEILSYLKDNGYRGYYSLEILNKSYRDKDPLEIALRAKKSMDDLLAAYGGSEKD